MHLHDERLVLLLPLAGVLVVLEREQGIQLKCFYMRTWYSRRIELRILMRTHFLTILAGRGQRRVINGVESGSVESGGQWPRYGHVLY